MTALDECFNTAKEAMTAPDGGFSTSGLGAEWYIKACTGRNLHSSIHYISCMCDTDNALHACRLSTDNMQGAYNVGIYILFIYICVQAVGHYYR